MRSEQGDILVNPPERRAEVLGLIKHGLEDFSLSREKVKWGIPLPFDTSQNTYVWVEALQNYITAAGYGDDRERFERVWTRGRVLHLMAKDILKFYAVFWPAMLLAAGVYPAFISAIAELSTLRFRPRSILVLGTVTATAALAILLLAGFMRSLVIEQRWVMYSLFIGLTLGGVPLVWRLARPATAGVFVAAAVSLALMALMWLELGGGGRTSQIVRTASGSDGLVS